MKTIAIAGRVGKDAEFKTTQTGTQLLRFTVAVSGRKREDPATWFSCSMFGKRGEALSRHITKGSAVCVVGDLEARTYDDREGKTRVDLGVVVQEITLLGKGGEGSGQRREARAEPAAGNFPADNFGDDDIPF